MTSPPAEPGSPPGEPGPPPAEGDSRRNGSGQPAGARPGLGVFTIEGRSAPALFVFGWIATILGVGIVVPGILGGAALPPPLLILGLVLATLGLIAGAGSQAIERRARDAPFTGPSPFLLFLAVIPTYLVLLVALLFVLAIGGVHLGDTPAGAVVSQVVLLGVYAGLIRLTVVGPGAASWSELGLRRPDEASSAIAFGAIIAVPLVFVSGLLAALLVQVLPTPPSPLPEANDRVGLLLNLLAAAVLAPIGEELFFRGFATTAWLRAIGPNAAILRGGLFFAFAHVLTLSGGSFGDAAGQAIVAFAVRVPVALALGWLFVRTRSIYPTIALHATFNGLPILLTLLRG